MNWLDLPKRITLAQTFAGIFILWMIQLVLTYDKGRESSSFHFVRSIFQGCFLSIATLCLLYFTKKMLYSLSNIADWLWRLSLYYANRLIFRQGRNSQGEEEVQEVQSQELSALKDSRILYRNKHVKFALQRKIIEENRPNRLRSKDQFKRKFLFDHSKSKTTRNYLNLYSAPRFKSRRVLNLNKVRVAQNITQTDSQNI